MAYSNKFDGEQLIAWVADIAAKLHLNCDVVFHIKTFVKVYTLCHNRCKPYKTVYLHIHQWGADINIDFGLQF